MAGAGKKTFVAGEVLTAAQVNDYLMDQAVMRFSGSAARAASITAPTEGMVTYLDDENRLEIYDGSAWVSADVGRLVQAKGDVIVGAAAGSVVKIPIGADNTVLTADATASGGMAWRAVSGGRAALFNITASATDTALTASLPAGYYSVSTSSSLSFSTAQFRFVGFDGALYGFPITGGTGVFTIPTDVASVNVTLGAPLTGLVTEITGVSSEVTSNPGPVVTGLAWQGIYNASFTASADPLAASIAIYNLQNGSLTALPTTASTATVVEQPQPVPYDTPGIIRFVQQNANGIWGTVSSASTTPYPYEVFASNGTYNPPPGSSSADVLVIAGGGGGGRKTISFYGPAGGGGGAGGVIRNTIPTTGSFAVTVGSGGATLGGGGNSSFGASISCTGGGRGGLGNSTDTTGGNGGSGGGRGLTGPGSAGTGIAGQGNNGANSGPSNSGGGGGKGGAASGVTGGAGQTDVLGYPYAMGGDGATALTSTAPTQPTFAFGAGGFGVGGGYGSYPNGSPGIQGLVVVKPL